MMGAASSSGGGGSMETPVKGVHNKHLNNVLDPRSPTAGITRTPIEQILDSPRAAETGEEMEGEAGGSEVPDPRSPTIGVVRTPLRAVDNDGLAALGLRIGELVLKGGDEGVEDATPSHKEQEGTGQGVEHRHPSNKHLTQELNIRSVIRQERPPWKRNLRLQAGKAVMERSPLCPLPHDNTPTRRPVKTPDGRICPSPRILPKVSHPSLGKENNGSNCPLTEA